MMSAATRQLSRMAIERVEAALTDASSARIAVAPRFWACWTAAS
jgi:hypothetical protein